MKAIKEPFSPQVYARIGGVLYLIIILAGMYGELFSRGKMVISGDPAATSNHILNAPLLFRSSIAVDLIMHICDVPLIVIFYFLLRPVSRTLSLLGASFNIVQTSILGINKLTLIAVISFLGNAVYLKSFNPQQLQTLSYIFLGLHEYGFSIGLIFFGCRCLIVGYLVYQSGFFPKILGILQVVVGFCYLVNSFALILVPAIAQIIFPFIILPILAGEGGMALWLLIKGVDLVKWKGAIRQAEIL